MYTANFHTHTFRCNHAYGTDREFVEAAIAGGLKTLGFSDHSPQCFPGSYYSGFRMHREQTEEYFSTLLALKEEYKDRIDIKIGFEAEYYPAIFEDLLKFLSPYPCDYLILGQHFIHNEYDEAETKGNLDYVHKYVNQVIEALDTGMYTYVAHPDLLNCKEDREAYYEEYQRLIDYCAKTGIPLEINCLGICDNRYYPHEPFWEMVGKTGAPVVIGSDAHRPEAIADGPTLKRAFEIVDTYHLNLVQPTLRPLRKA